MFSVLLIAKSTPLASALGGYLDSQFEVIRVCSEIKVIHLMNSRKIDAILVEEDCDKKFISRVLDHLHSQDINAPIIVYSKQDDPEFIISIMKGKADDYILMKNDFKQLKARVLQCVQKRFPFYAAGSKYGDGWGSEIKELQGPSEQVREMKCFVATCASTNETVMLYGESGTGKNFIARLIHKYSPRRLFRFRVINCGAIPETLVESELFGSEVGAFTDAITRMGIFAQAHRGTLLLDELGDLHSLSQAKILQVMDEKRYTPLGSKKEFKVDVRFIAATNKNIREMIARKEFRLDLYHRMSVLPYTIAPLRERVVDIPYLAYNFLYERNKNGFFSSNAMDKLMNYSWPGNIRELKNCIIRAEIVSSGDKISTSHISFDS